MVTHREAMEVIADTLREDRGIPQEMSYLLHEADPEGEDAAVSLPMVEMQDVQVLRDDPSNSTFLTYLVNDDGEEVGYVYETKWEMRLQMDIWTAAGSDYDADELGKQLRKVLFAYDTRGPGMSFTDDQGEPVDDIYDFSLRRSLRNDELNQTPSVRRFRQVARVRGAEILTKESPAPVIRETTEDAQLQ